jgi:hypothetical protein
VKQFFLIVIFYCSLIAGAHGQTNTIFLEARLIPDQNRLEIEQQILYFNTTNDTLEEVYLHNWANAYRDKTTPLARRFTENYSKIFHFAKKRQRGRTDINSITANFELVNWETGSDQPDVLKVRLPQQLHPGDSVRLSATYAVDIPNDRFTKYGVNQDTYNLRYWYLIPAVYDGNWHTYSNLDMDDLYMEFTNYEIRLKIPARFNVQANLPMEMGEGSGTRTVLMKGKHRRDIEVFISPEDTYDSYEFDNIRLRTNMTGPELSHDLKTSILKRGFNFIQFYLGEYPHEDVFLNKIAYEKNPVYGFNQLPEFLTPFSHTFEWDISLFKVLSRHYLDQVMVFDPRTDGWLADGIQNYLMIKYVERFYPEIKAIGEISKLWGIRKFNIAKISFNDKYPYVYQFAARQNLDQALTMQADSLSNFNRKIVNKYKAGLGLRYLEAYLEDVKFQEELFQFSIANSGKRTTSNTFLEGLKKKTTKDIYWFESDYLTTNKKVDYTIKEITEVGDSLDVLIKNKRNFTVPVQLYGIKDQEVKYQSWVTGIDSLGVVRIPKDGFDQLSLNYQAMLPEYNLRNNWRSVGKRLLHRPLQVKFLKDIENPYYNQFFYMPEVRYNYYDGLALGVSLSNRTIMNKNFQYKILPSYSTKSRTFSGSYSVLYEYLPENKKIDKFTVGATGSRYNYAEDLTYQTFYPFAMLQFKRKNLRDVSSKIISASYVLVDREEPETLASHPETYSYRVFNLGFGYAKPEIIDDFRFGTGLQIAENFAKMHVVARYRKLTDTNRQFDFRFFAGTFLSNNTETDYFSFALDRPTDYLFQYDYLGRSETEGIFSQQVIINEGGFKSKLPEPYANQWLTTLNTSIGLWRWIEVYNDIGFVKNRGHKVYFAHENGIRLNFIQDILELYFPLHSNLGWEISQSSYASKIRFVLVIKPRRIYNFIRRGFY